MAINLPCSIALALSHKFWCIAFYLSFISVYLKVFLDNSSLMHELLRSVMYSFQVLGIFSVYLSVTNF